MDTQIIEQLIYEDTTGKKTISWINKNTDPKLLYVYAYNYNWDEGFEIPKQIINSRYCTLSTALLLFYRAEGEQYLIHKENNIFDNEWYEFISDVYSKIINNTFNNSNIQFKCPLTKVQIYKLSKIISDNEKVFITDLPGENFNISL